MPIIPTFETEQTYWQQGIQLLAGVDEVGMGALAGPVVAAAVIWDQEKKTPPSLPLSSLRSRATAGTAGEEKFLPPALSREASGRSGNKGDRGGFHLIRDSKTLSAKQRELAQKYIKDHAVAWAIGEASVQEITKLNIRRASHLAMQRAIDSLQTVPELLLIDGTPAQPHPHIPAVNIIDGDALSLSIAAASIIAKVHRDQLMNTISEQYPAFGFVSNKGYGSAVHMAALAEIGPSPAHRVTYAPVAKALANRI